MVLSRRERYVLIATAAVVAVLALDRLAVSPLLARRAKTGAERDRLVSERDRANVLLARREQLAPRWRQMEATGLKSDAGEAESQILHAIRDWAEEAGVSLSLLKPDRLAEKSRLPEIAFQASGTGKMGSVARLLWRVQTATIPIKVTEIQLSARKEGVDDLSFQMRISTLYAPSRTAQVPAAVARGPTGPEIFKLLDKNQQQHSPMRQTISILGRLTLLLAALATGATTTSAPSASRGGSWEDYRAILERNIFARDRTAPSREPGDLNRPSAAGVEQSLVLTGVAVRGGVPLAFFEDGRTGETAKVALGQDLHRGKIISISLDSVEYRSGDTTRKIFLGENLTGVAGTLQGRLASSQPAAGPQETGKAGDTTDRNTSDTLERMRQRRLQEIRP